MFFKKNKDLSIFKDAVFEVSDLAKQDKDPNVVNATIGSLCDEEGKIISFDSVFKCYDALSNTEKTAYAKGPLGNPDYLKAITNFILEKKCQGKAIATSGGTGAITLGLDLCLNPKDRVIIPNIAWGNYKQMLIERDLVPLFYDPYNVDELCRLITEHENPFVIINSPCQNPCGLSYSFKQWQQITEALNNSKKAILLNDIAYIDYAYKDYLSLIDKMGVNVLTLIAFSCSKTFSYYGQRLGALVVINKDTKLVDLFINQCEKHIRTTYGSCNNGAMIAITKLLNNHLDEFKEELSKYRALLKKRTDLFIQESNEVNLNLYPYNEGFFVTIKYPCNDFRDKIHAKLIKNHIYCVKVNKGIRVGLCSTPLLKIKGLSKRIKDIEKSLMD